ncbi:MAG: type III pantothenate kinase [Campylobacterota bacterium]|nr:type III pantothenate kinase [Campylobacterota bacterium]
MESGVMLLCDIGNSSYHFLKDKELFKQSVNTFDPFSIKEEVYYICVNPKIKIILNSLTNWVDLAKYIDMQSYYSTMGIDRIVASMAVEDGLIIDAGSAITVDIVKNSKFMGGYIYPGLKAMTQTYKNISTALDYSLNFEIDLDIMPKNSQDAISYGYLKTLSSEVMSHNMNIIITGGDADKFKIIFPHAQIDEALIFKGMKKIIQNNQLAYK